MLIKRWQKKPIDDSLIVFESEGDMSDNAYALYNYLRNNGYLKKYKAVWLVDDTNKYRNCSFGNTEFFKKFPYKTEPKRAKYLGTCKYYIYDHCNMLRDAEKRDGQKIIYLSHGGILKKAKAKALDFWNNDEFYITGESFVKGMQDWTDAKAEQIIDIGFPRLDYFFSPVSSGASEYAGKLRLKDYRCVILWMPTYRQSTNEDLSEDYNSTETGLPFLGSLETVEEFNSWLSGKNALCIMKIHHLQKKLDIFDKKFSNIVFLSDTDLSDNGVQLYEIIGLTDALITDWSSVAFDYMLLDKPILFTMDDISDYTRSRGFVCDPTPLFVGYQCVSRDSFYGALEDVLSGRDAYREARNKLLPSVHTHTDGFASKRIAERLGL